MAVETFRRTVMARLAPVMMAGILLVLLAADAAAGRLTLSWWLVGVGALALLSILAAIMALGDEILVDERGILSRNRLLRRERFVAWEEIREVRPVHGRSGERLKAVFVVPHRGPRLILDSLRSLERLARLIQEAHRRASEPRL